MHRRTAVALALVVLALVAPAGYAMASGGGHLEERWVSDTVRENDQNHHAIGAAGGLVVAPVAEPTDSPAIREGSCALVRLAPRTGAALWRYGVPSADCALHSLTEPAIADVDGDGEREVLAATTEEALVAIDARTGDEAFRVPLSNIGYSRPTVANLTGDATPEVVVSDIGGEVVAVDGNGTVIWRRALDEGVFHHPLAGDVDGDGATEVVVGLYDRVAVLAADTGAVERVVPVGGRHVALGQADDDAVPELVATTTGAVAAYDVAEGSTLWEREFGGTPKLTAVADADGDGREVAFVAASGTRVAAIDVRTGDVEWERRLATGDNGTPPAPQVGDLDGDGDGEVVAVDHDGTVFVLDPATGGRLATYERDTPIRVHPTLADVDGDGREEVLVRYGDGRVVALSYAERGVL